MFGGSYQNVPIGSEYSSLRQSVRLVVFKTFKSCQNIEFVYLLRSIDVYFFMLNAIYNICIYNAYIHNLSGLIKTIRRLVFSNGGFQSVPIESDVFVFCVKVFDLVRWNVDRFVFHFPWFVFKALGSGQNIRVLMFS